MLLGIAVIGAIVVTPAQQQLDRAQWYHGFVKLYAQREHEQVRNYERFSSALSAGDPVVLSRLAFTHLRLKPEGSELVSVPMTDFGNTTYHVSDQPSFIDSPDASDVSDDLTSSDRYHLALIEQWLHTNEPVVGIDYLHYKPRQDTVSRLATGPAKVPLLAIGAMLIWAGLMMPGGKPSGEASSIEDEFEEEYEDEFEDDGWVQAELDFE